MLFSCCGAKVPQPESEKKKILKSPKAKIKNPKDNTKKEAGGIIRVNKLYGSKNRNGP